MRGVVGKKPRRKSNLGVRHEELTGDTNFYI
jgi:hypothetical protein